MMELTSGWIGAGVLTLLVILFGLYLVARTRQVPVTVPGEYYENELKKMEAIISRWIEEEIRITSMVVELASFNDTFLGKLSTVNFKAIGIAPEVASTIDALLVDTPNVRTLSHFLDLVRDIDLYVDTNVIHTYRSRYFQSLMTLGPTPYTHNKKQMKTIVVKYPWLWLLEILSRHELVVNTMVANKYTVETDNSQAMKRNIDVKAVSL